MIDQTFATQVDRHLSDGPPLAAACSLVVIGTSQAPKLTCPALNAAIPALLPTLE